MKKLREFTDGNFQEKKKLMRELDAIRKSGEGLITAPKNMTVLKRSIFRKQKEKDEELVTPENSDDEDDEELEIITESGRSTPGAESEQVD